MSFEKNYPNRKDHRRPLYRRSAPGCRHQRHCSICSGDRQFSKIKAEAGSKADLREWLIVINRRDDQDAFR